MSEISYRGLFNLTGKTSIVTGGAGILGEHFCAGLADSGATVCTVDLVNCHASGPAEALHLLY